jgi:hypothetical protein
MGVVISMACSELLAAAEVAPKPKPATNWSIDGNALNRRIFLAA